MLVFDFWHFFEAVAAPDVPPIRRVCPIIVPVYRAYHQTRVSDFKKKLMEKRVEVLSDYTPGLPRFTHDKEDPTGDHMRSFSER